jgi:hypothetical protein
MVFGGIPFYWNEVTSGKSAFQNINDVCFTENGLLHDEFPNLFRSLFNNYQSHEVATRLLIYAKFSVLFESATQVWAAIPYAGWLKTLQLSWR